MAIEDVLESVGPEHDISGMEYKVDTVMVLSGIELIFFTEACMMTCFGILMKIMVITHQCF